MSQTPELLPCPWCHEKPSLTSGYSQQGATVECVQEKCPLNPGAYVNARPGENSSLLIDEARQEAIRKWNTRAQPAVDEAVEAVDKLLIHAKRNDDNKFHHWNRMEELAEIIRTALAQSTQSPVEQPPQTVAGDAEYCWLIECQPLWDSKHGPIYYWSGNGNAEGWGNDSGWTTDAYKAVRFARKFDAERVIAFHVPPNRRFAKAVEHAFDPPLTRHKGA